MAANGTDHASLEAAIADVQEAVKKQGDVVRGLKAEHKDGKVERVSIAPDKVFVDCTCHSPWHAEPRPLL
jgi:hypothetical protein